MSNNDRDISEEGYYGHICNSLDYGEMPDTPVIDFVASIQEWQNCKRALLRWIAEKDAEYDELACEQEHEDSDA